MSQRQTRTKCGGTLQPCQSVEFQIQNSCIQMQNCTYIRRLARMGPYLRHAHLSCFKRKWTLRLCRAYTVAFEPLTKTRLVISFSASSLADCDVEFSSSISSPHLARLDYPISSHSPQALLSPVFRKCFTDSINPTFVTCCISNIGPPARFMWEGDWLTVGSHGSM